jgi:pimeloyl-ACP methyl ester carboxylesterase
VDHVGAGPLVIFLHGIGGNRTNWHDQLAEFGAHFHAVAWDARGYGASDDYDGALDFGDFAVDMARVAIILAPRVRTWSASRWVGSSRWISPRAIPIEWRP